MKFSCNSTIIGLTVNLTKNLTINLDKESSNGGNHTGDQDRDTNEDEGNTNEDEGNTNENEENTNENEGNTNENEANQRSGDNKQGDNIDVKRDTDSIHIFPSIQVWRLLNSKSVYTKVGQHTICDRDIKPDGDSALAIVYLTANKSLRFQPDDVIGYYVPANSYYSVLNMRTIGNTSYSINTNASLDNFAMNDSTSVSMLPLIQEIVGKREL